MSASNSIVETTNERYSLFLGLTSYSEKDASRFFGRDEQSQELYHLIKYNTLTLLFGKSGTGKTSLLNAGVFPRLRVDNCLPFAIRLSFNTQSPPLLTQVWQVLQTQVALYGFKIDSFVEGETLWEFFHRENLWRIVTPILLFDQFEELFTIATKYPKRKDELNELLSELENLIENTFPDKVKERYLAADNVIGYEYRSQKVKVIFSFREDFLVEMESITRIIPAVKNARYRLMPMNGQAAFEVITKTWNAAIEEEQAIKIITYLVADMGITQTDTEQVRSRLHVVDIEPSLLSQVCYSLDRERTKDRSDEMVTADFLSRFPKENLLLSIYEKALNDSVADAIKEDEPPPARASNNDNDGKQLQESAKKTKRRAAALSVATQVFIEDKLVDDQGFRDKWLISDIPPEIAPVLNQLKSRFFIRQEGLFIELSHDVIANVLKDKRKARLRAEARKKAFKNAVFIVVIAGIVSVVTLSLSEYFVYLNIEEYKKIKRKIEISENATPNPTNKTGSPKIYMPHPTTDDTTVAYYQKLLEEYQKRLGYLDQQIEKQRNEISMMDEVIKNTRMAMYDSINRYAFENKRLQQRVNHLLVDTGVIYNYSTLVNQIVLHKDSSRQSMIEKINLLEKHWEPFQRRTLQSRGN